MTAPPPPSAEPSAAIISQYPAEHRHIRQSLALSVFLHLFVAALICLVMYWLGLSSLKDILLRGSIAETGPAAETPMTVELVEEDLTPPPTPNPEFIKQIVKPKVIPPPPKKLTPKPQPPKPRPHYTAPNAHGQGITQNVAQARVGSAGFPAPSYPYAALNARQEGTVHMQVTFGSDGSVASATIIQSSGVTLLDVSTRNFIYGHWSNAQFANQTITIPIVYDLSNPTSAH
jgi:TonB family protein